MTLHERSLVLQHIYTRLSAVYCLFHFLCMRMIVNTIISIAICLATRWFLSHCVVGLPVDFLLLDIYNMKNSEYSVEKMLFASIVVVFFALSVSGDRCSSV